MRGGVFKPRSSPYAFRGLGVEGLKMWDQLAKGAGIKIISEVMQVSQIAEMYDYVDVFQVGARNTQNFNLLDELGKVDKPVMIKRGISGTIEELLSSAEYVFSGGNEKLILCERGIRTYEKASRNTMDINAIPILKEKSHLPVVADPSHGIGIREYVEPVALAAVMAGADGIIYETHQKPEEAYSDAQQTLDFSESERLIRKMKEAFELRDSWSYFGCRTTRGISTRRVLLAAALVTVPVSTRLGMWSLASRKWSAASRSRLAGALRAGGLVVWWSCSGGC